MPKRTNLTEREYTEVYHILDNYDQGELLGVTIEHLAQWKKKKGGRRPSKGRMIRDLESGFGSFTPPKRRRKLSKWQQFVKKNAKFPRFKYKSGKKKGMINLKALGVAYRKKKK